MILEKRETSVLIEIMAAGSPFLFLCRAFNTSSTISFKDNLAVLFAILLHSMYDLFWIKNCMQISANRYDMRSANCSYSRGYSLVLLNILLNQNSLK